MNNKANSTSFKKGHSKVGGFSKGDKHTPESIALLSGSMKGNKNRWKGDAAGYVAKHMWIYKNFGKASQCENLFCSFKNPKRFEWANISKQYKRERDDYKQLCPSCHRKWDMGRIVL